MTPETCHGCTYHKRQYGNDLCTRPIKGMDGREIENTRFTWAETHEEAAGCGPSRRHFKAGSVM